MGDSTEDICYAVQRGASKEELEELIARAPQWEIDGGDDDGRTALDYAVEREPGIFKVILDAMSKDAVVQKDYYGYDPLHEALSQGNKAAVMAVAKRMDREENWNPFAIVLQKGTRLDSLCIGPLVADREVVDLVAGLVPDWHFTEFDPLVLAVQSDHDSEYAVDLCLRKLRPGETQRRKLFRVGPLFYVSEAAKYKDVAMVRKLHEHMRSMGTPGLVEGLDYSTAFAGAAVNKKHSVAILEYLADHADIGGQCKSLNRCLTECHNVAAVKWLLTRCPSLLEAACKEAGFVQRLVVARHDVMEHLISEILTLIDRDVIVKMLHERKEVEQGWEIKYRVLGSGNDWRWKVSRIYEEVPEAMDGSPWELLMAAVRDGNELDVDYLLGLCTPEDLAKRDEKGDTAWDVASRSKRFPDGLLARLVVSASE